MNEFNLIDFYFKNNNLNKNTILGIGDDAAVVKINNTNVVSCVDTLVEGVHFAKNYKAKDIATKALAANLSDIAAMGAIPKWFSLALTMPKVNHKWLAEFSKSLFKTANKYDIDLIGGDTTKGTLTISIQVIGITKKNNFLTRSNAKLNDDIYVSGTIGNAALALKGYESLNEYLFNPAPRIELGKNLIGVANSCIDISDGLLQDLEHILTKSNVGANIDLEKIPLGNKLKNYIKETNDWCLALAGGDDYELCFTVDEKYRPEIKAISRKLNIKLTNIGKITNVHKLNIKGFNDNCKGYKHF